MEKQEEEEEDESWGDHAWMQRHLSTGKIVNGQLEWN